MGCIHTVLKRYLVYKMNSNLRKLNITYSVFISRQVNPQANDLPKPGAKCASVMSFFGRIFPGPLFSSQMSHFPSLGIQLLCVAEAGA